MRGVFALLELHKRKRSLGVQAKTGPIATIVFMTVINYQP
jgi:hypothetical protein